MSRIASFTLTTASALMLALAHITPAHAALLDQWGAHSLTFAYQCDSSPCNGFDSTTLVEGPNDFQPQGFHSDALYSDGTFGSAQAHADLTALPGIHIPELKVRAHGNSNHLTLGVVRAAQAYTYIGPSSTSITLTGILTGTVTNPLDSNLSRIIADIFVYDADEAEASVAPGGHILLESRVPAASLYHSNFGLDADSIGVNAGAFVMDLDPGDTFYLYATLVAQAGDTATSDAMSTLTLEFSDTTHLVAAASTVIPVPAAVWLFASGLLGLAIAARRKV